MPLEIAFEVYFGRFRQKAAPGDDVGAILGRTFAGSNFLSIFDDFRGRPDPKKQAKP